MAIDTVKTRMLLIILLLILYAVPSIYTSPAPRGKVVAVYVDGTVDEGLVYLVRRAAAAAEGGTLILVVDSYGGYLRSMDSIVEIVSSCPCNTVAWIPPGGKAVSAAAVVALSANKLYVGKGAVLGAIHPWPSDSKVLAYMTSRVESLLAKKGVRNATEIAAGMVYNNTTFDYKEMLRLGIAEGEADSFPELLQALGLRGVSVVEYRRGFVSDLFSFLFDPGTALMLVVLGILLVIFGVKAGGHHGLLLTGLALIALAFYSLDIIGGSLLTFTLLAIGIFALILELKKPGIQVFGALGLTLIVLAVLFEYYRRPYVEFGLNLAPVIAGFAILAGFLLFVIAKASATLKMKPVSIEDRLLGKVGYAKTPISPGKVGVVNVESEDWSAVSDEEIKAGEKVRVVGVEGLTLRVERVADEKALSSKQGDEGIGRKNA